MLRKQSLKITFTQKKIACAAPFGNKRGLYSIGTCNKLTVLIRDRPCHKLLFVNRLHLLLYSSLKKKIISVEYTVSVKKPKIYN